MQRTLITKILFLICSTLALVACLYATNQIDYIHGAVFSASELFLLPVKLARIDPIGYAASLMEAVCVAALFSLACLSLGTRLIGGLVAKEIEIQPLSLTGWLAMLCTAFVAGHGLFSILLVTLGTLSQFKFQIIVPALLLGLLVGLPALRRAFSQLPASRPGSLGELFTGGTDRIMLALSIAILFICLLYSSSRLSYDSVAFYLSDEKITALTDHIQFFGNNTFTASSFQAGISYAALIKIWGEQAARVYTWINSLVVILFGLAIGEKLGLSKQARLLVLVLMLTSTAFLDLTGDGKVEIISTAAALAAIYWLIGNSGKQTDKISLLTGLLAGLAIASRPYNAFLLGLFFALYFLVEIGTRKPPDRSGLLRSIFWIGVGVLCFLLSHLYVNWAILGDPFAFLKNLQAVDSPDNWFWTVPPQDLWIVRLLYPVSVMLLNTPQSLGNISVLLSFALSGIVLGMTGLRTWLARPAIALSLIACVTLGVWLCLIYTVFEIRYVLFLWILLFIPIAVAVERLLSNPDVLVKSFMRTVLVLLLFVTATRSLFVAIDTYSPTDQAGNSHCSDYIYCDLMGPINASAPVGSRVLALNSYKYYLRQDLFMCASKHDEYFILQNLSVHDQTAFWLEVYQEGYSYIAYEQIYSSQHLRFGVVPDPGQTPTWIKLQPIYGKPGDKVVSYKIVANNPPAPIREMCVQNGSGIWDVTPVTAPRNH